jgi:hypothetical protein
VARSHKHFARITCASCDEGSSESGGHDDSSEEEQDPTQNVKRRGGAHKLAGCNTWQGAAQRAAQAAPQTLCNLAASSEAHTASQDRPDDDFEEEHHVERDWPNTNSNPAAQVYTTQVDMSASAGGCATMDRVLEIGRLAASMPGELLLNSEAHLCNHTECHCLWINVCCMLVVVWAYCHVLLVGSRCPSGWQFLFRKTFVSLFKQFSQP